MNRLSSFALTLGLFLGLYATILYTSCNKDNCQGVTCFNGSTCSGGVCKCQPGFAGLQCNTRASTKIIYQNNTQVYLDVSVNANGSGFGREVSPGDTFSVTGGFGTFASTNIQSFSSYGEQINMTRVDTFPTAGTVTVPINVSADYFYLYVNNKNASYYVDEIIVNQGLSSQYTLASQYIYNDGYAHAIGYFKAVPGCNVYLYNASSSQTWSFTSLGLPGTINQVYTAVAN